MVAVKQPTKKEKLFAAYYARTRDPRASAALAGFTLPQPSAYRLLGKEEIRAKIKEEISAKESSPDEAAQGYRRLAFGGCADAVRLMKNWDCLTGDEIEKLDLFNVAEIKLPKSGGIEIKFFDRLKALDRLENTQTGSETAEASLLSALCEGANALGGEEL